MGGPLLAPGSDAMTPIRQLAVVFVAAGTTYLVADWLAAWIAGGLA